MCLSALFKNDSSSWLQTEETPPDLGTDRGERKERQVCSFFFVWEEFTQENKTFPDENVAAASYRKKCFHAGVNYHLHCAAYVSPGLISTQLCL